MKRKKSILNEVEKTLSSLDNVSNLEPNPYLFTRIKAHIEGDNIVQIKGEARNLIMNPVVLTIFLIINIVTVVFLFQSNSSSQNTLVNSLTKDYQFSQTKFDIFTMD